MKVYISEYEQPGILYVEKHSKQPFGVKLPDVLFAKYVKIMDDFEAIQAVSVVDF